MSGKQFVINKFLVKHFQDNGKKSPKRCLFINIELEICDKRFQIRRFFTLFVAETKKKSQKKIPTRRGDQRAETTVLLLFVNIEGLGSKISPKIKRFFDKIHVFFHVFLKTAPKSMVKLNFRIFEIQSKNNDFYIFLQKNPEFQTEQKSRNVFWYKSSKENAPSPSGAVFLRFLNHHGLAERVFAFFAKKHAFFAQNELEISRILPH